MTVTIQPNPNESGKSWCLNCREKHPLFLVYGFRTYGGWTNLCRSCLEDLGVLPPDPERNGHTPPAEPTQAVKPAPRHYPPVIQEFAQERQNTFDGTYPLPADRGQAGVKPPPPPGSGESRD